MHVYMEKCKEFVDSCKIGTRTVRNAMEKSVERNGEWHSHSYVFNDNEDLHEVANW